MDIRVLHEDTSTRKAVVCSDRPADGNVCHRYQVIGVPCDEVNDGMFAKVNFQKGPVKEAGVNGCQNEDLLLIVIDRLEHFQDGPFACDENQVALIAARKSLHALQSRTKNRETRNVEGTSQK